MNLTGGDHPERFDVLAVSPNYFSILGAQPQLGRLFDARDTFDGFAEAVVISDSLWHKEFGGDPSVVGRRVRLDNDLYTIVGVFLRSFTILRPRACTRWNVAHRGLSCGALPGAAAQPPLSARTHRKTETRNHSAASAGAVGSPQRFLAPRLWERLSGNRWLGSLDHVVDGSSRRQRENSAEISSACSRVDSSDRVRQRSESSLVMPLHGSVRWLSGSLLARPEGESSGKC